MITVSRRRFVQGASLAGLGLLAACATVTLPTMPSRRPAVVALLLADETPAAVSLDPFRQGLAERGWALGHNLVLAERSADGDYGRLPEMAAELLALPPDVIVTVSTPATLAARNASVSVPIVFATGSNPVAQGLANSHPRPGGNVTGITTLTAELTGKRLELLREMMPTAGRVALFWQEPAALVEAERASQALGVDLYPIEVPSLDSLRRGLAAAVAWGAEALQFEPQPIVRTVSDEVAVFATAHRLPAMSGNGGFARAGGLATYAPPVQENFRRAADYVDKVLRGAKAADLPIEQPMVFDFVINLKTAQALGLTIPPHVLLQATEVIQ